MYAKVHLTESFHLRVGWNLHLFSNISRADDNIYYNDNGVANPPAVRARAEEERSASRTSRSAANTSSK